MLFCAAIYLSYGTKRDERGQIDPFKFLKNTYPQLYEKYTEKYFDHPKRPKLLKKQVPKLNCLWNDVLHFLPLHPYFVYQALTSLEIKTKEKQSFYKIPIEKLKNNKNAIYLYSQEKYKGPAEPIDENEMELLAIKDYKELTGLPSATYDYYENESRKGNRFGLFPYIPHVLSIGDVEIKDVAIITWDEFSEEG